MILWTLVAIALYSSLAAVFKRANIVWLHWNVYLCKVLLWFNFKTEKKRIDKKKGNCDCFHTFYYSCLVFVLFFSEMVISVCNKRAAACMLKKLFFFWCHLSRRCDDRRFWLSGGAVALQSDERMRPFVIPAKPTLAFNWSAKHFFLWMLQNKHEEKWITGKQNWQTKKGGGNK